MNLKVTMSNGDIFEFPDAPKHTIDAFKDIPNMCGWITVIEEDKTTTLAHQHIVSIEVD